MKIKYQIPLVLGLTLIALLMFFGGAVAELKVVNVFYTWDEKQISAGKLAGDRRHGRRLGAALSPTEL